MKKRILAIRVNSCFSITVSFFFFYFKKLKRAVWEDKFSGGLCEVYTPEIT